MTGGKPVQKDFNVIVERDEEGFYVATVPELREKGDALKKLS
jgi:hypothetical protein